jgi:Ion channel
LIVRIWKERVESDSRIRESGLTVLLVVQAFEIFLADPLEAMGKLPLIARGGLDTIVFLVALGVMSPNRRAQGLIVICALADVASVLLHRVEPSSTTLALDFAARIVFLAALSFVLLRMVFRNDDEGTYHRIQGGIVVYLNITMAFALIYRMASLVDPHSFNSAVSSNANLADFLYFSFTTITTTGYGDITPLHPLVRSAANLESVIGTLYPPTLLARLVVRYFT